MRASLVLVAWLAAAGSAAAEPADELAVIVNLDNTATVSSADLESVYQRKESRWSGGEQIVPFNAPPDARPRQLFDRAVLAMSADEAARYWLDQRIRSGTIPPREVGDPALTVKLVARLKGAIGYVPKSTDLHGVRVVAWIRGGKVLPP